MIRLLKITAVASIVLGTIAQFGCNRTKEFIGPEYVVADENFKADSFALSSADLHDFVNSPPLTFSAGFSQRISWNLTFRGLSSGATYSLSGVDRAIALNQYTWDGTHQNLQFFLKGEKVVAELSFLGTSLKMYDTITVQNAKKFDGILLTDFETSSMAYTFADGSPITASDQLRSANNVKDTIVRNFDGSSFLDDGHLVRSIQGKYLYRMAGKDRTFTGPGASDYYICGAGIQKDFATLLDSNAANVYFNIYVYGTGDPNAKLTINFNEDDDGDNNADEIITEDVVALEIPVSWKGWRLMSYRYNSIPFSTVPGQGNNGNKKYEPTKVKKLGFVLITLTPGEQTQVHFDYPVFTLNKPFMQ